MGRHAATQHIDMAGFVHVCDVLWSSVSGGTATSFALCLHPEVACSAVSFFNVRAALSQLAVCKTACNALPPMCETLTDHMSTHAVLAVHAMRRYFADHLQMCLQSAHLGCMQSCISTGD